MPSFSKKQITTLSFLFLLILMLVIPSAHAAGSRYCKVDHYHSGAGDTERSQSLAKRSANRAWSSFTAWEYGQKWGNISVSMDRSYNCSHPTTGWKCTVMAKPCKITGRVANKKKKYTAKKSRRASKKSYRKRVRNKRSYRKRSRAKKYSRKSRRSKIRKQRRVMRKKWSMKW